jgi:hypothetical protein
LNISEGSLAEASYCVHAAWRLGYINDKTLAELETDLNAVGAPLAGLIRSTRTMPLVIPGVALAIGVAIGRLFF